MIYCEENKEINLKIAFDLAQKRFNDISNEEISNIAKEYKKFVINVIKELEQYDTENDIIDYRPSI